jgi:hypothetical protein
MDIIKSKEIIKAISKGEVYDLTSFVTIFCKEDMFKYDCNEIQRRKKSDFSEAKIKEILTSYEGKYKSEVVFNGSGFSSAGFIQGAPEIKKTSYCQKDYDNIEAQLRNTSIKESDFIINLELNENKFSINTFREKVFTIKDFSKIREFFEVWDYLVSNRLVSIKPKTISNADARVFFMKEKQDINEHIGEIHNTGIEFDGIPLKHIFGDQLAQATIYKKNDIEYADIKLKRNDALISLAQEYLNKKIITTEALVAFVNRGYLSFVEYAFSQQLSLNRKAFVISIATLFVSIVFSLVTIYITLTAGGLSAKEMRELENNKSSIMQEQVNKIDGLLSEINKLKDEISSESAAQELSKLNKNIEQLIKQKETQNQH